LRLLYDAKGLDAEREAYRLTVLLTLVTTIKTLLNLIESSQNFNPSTTTSTFQSGDDSIMFDLPPDPILDPRPSTSSAAPSATDLHHVRRLRLAAVLALEMPLRQRLGVVDVHSPSHPSFLAHALDLTSQFETDVNLFDRLSQDSDIKSTILHRFQPKRLPGSKPIDLDPQFFVVRSRWTNQEVEIHDDLSVILSNCRNDMAQLYRDCVDNGLIASEGPKTSEEGGFDLEYSSKYFLSCLDRITAPDFIPTVDDMLHVRISTMGIEEHLVHVSSKYIYRVVDVAGARGQRHHWAAYFDGPGVIIFIVATSEYDQFLDQNSGINLLQDAMELFGLICSNQLLQQSAIVLFLNKIDAFKTKLKSGRAPFGKFFSNFAGSEQSFDQARKFIKAQFHQVSVNSPFPNRKLYSYFLQATNTRSTRNTLDSVQDMLFRKNLETTGVM